MSVLIKGMTLPKNCSVCPLLQDNSDVYTPFYCPLVQEAFDCDYVLKQNGRPENCPLVDVPAPHGRLIDADKLADYWEPDNSRVFSAGYFIHTVVFAKTIIEAEK